MGYITAGITNCGCVRMRNIYISVITITIFYIAAGVKTTTAKRNNTSGIIKTTVRA
nr:MAG TPA: hypothetical protein [Caudoviricetes sp.]